MNLWRAYEVMEAKAGNIHAAQAVYQRSIKDSIVRDELYFHASKVRSHYHRHEVVFTNGCCNSTVKILSSIFCLKLCRHKKKAHQFLQKVIQKRKKVMRLKCLDGHRNQGMYLVVERYG